MFLDCHHLGHETADIMASKIIDSLLASGLSLEKMITLSRDNPSVMKALDKLFREKAEAEGNPRVLSSPDYLHPCHTALREGMKELGSNLEKFLVDVYTFFKLSTARREDLLKVREIFEENDEFFHRYVSSRWLTTGPVAERLVEHWSSLREYFLTYLPSQRDQSSKDAIATVRYQDIVGILKPGEDIKNLARLHFLIHVCKLNKHFLLLLQSEKPKIHVLYIECVKLISIYINIVCDSSKIDPNLSGRKISQLNFHRSGLILPVSRCFFGASTEKDLGALSENVSQQLRSEFRSAIIKTIKYLVSHFPLNDRFLMDLIFLDPDMRAYPDFVKKLVRAADHTGRFAKHEMEDLGVQLQAVKSLNLKEFDDDVDQIDIVWVGICAEVEKVIRDKPEALWKFIKFVLALPHSNAFLERGFSDLKRIITGRERLALESTNAQKSALDFIRLAGGSTKVPVTFEMMECVKEAHLKKEQESRRKIREEERKNFQKKMDEEQREKKRKFDEEKNSWQEKYKLKAEAAQVLREELDIQSRALTDALELASESKKETTRKAAVNAAKEAQKNISLTRQLYEFAQKEAEQLMGKKPKL